MIFALSAVFRRFSRYLWVPVSVLIRETRPMVRGLTCKNEQNFDLLRE
jgi:hypothetical protein